MSPVESIKLTSYTVEGGAATEHYQGRSLHALHSLIKRVCTAPVEVYAVLAGLISLACQ